MKNKDVCICLNRHGEILIFNEGVLKISFRRGAWVLFDHKSLVRKLAYGNKHFNETLRQAIYATALDVSFARCGGCLGYITGKHARAATRLISAEDEISLTSTKMKSKFLALLPIRKLNLMDRRLRQEIAGIDGATIFGSDGELISAGAIISYKSGSEGGGRTAAAKKISEYGIAIKISADGKVSTFHDGNSGFVFG